LQPCSLAEIIEKAQETVKAGFAEHQTTIAVQFPPRDDRLLADPLLLRQVFVNLFQNAAEAIAEGGRIDVRILPPAGSEEEAGRWLVRVGDTGPGIPGADHERIFQPFVTSKERGTGLGLPIARKIVSAHGGYLSVESSTPAGTVFLLRLPHRPISTPVGGPREQPAPAG
jgi:signal transduction histidine kinase